MNLYDLDILDKPLYYKESDYVDISPYIVRPDGKKKNMQMITKEFCSMNFSFVYELIEGTKDDIDDMILRNLMKYNKLKEYKAPYELQARLYTLRANTTDFTKYPTFYTQEFLHIINYYTKESPACIKSPYSFKSLAEKIFGERINFLTRYNLKTENDDSGDGLGEMYVRGAGVAIMPTEFLKTLTSREMIIGVKFKEGVGLNVSPDRRKLSGCNSILDWRKYDCKGNSR